MTFFEQNLCNSTRHSMWPGTHTHTPCSIPSPNTYQTKSIMFFFFLHKKNMKFFWIGIEELVACCLIALFIRCNVTYADLCQIIMINTEILLAFLCHWKKPVLLYLLTLKQNVFQLGLTRIEKSAAPKLYSWNSIRNMKIFPNLFKKKKKNYRNMMKEILFLSNMLNGILLVFSYWQ